jgi:hypothetical protein
MRQVTAPGRWVWGASGLATVLALAAGGIWLITAARTPQNGAVTAFPSRTITVTQHVTSLNVQSYGAPVRVTAGPGYLVQVTETIMFNPQNGGPPAVTQSVSGGRLTLAAPSCADLGCSVGFEVTVPAGVTVTAASDGGPVTVSGTAGANLDSSSGLVRATGIDGPLTVTSDGGGVNVDGLTGPLHVDTGSGTLLARGVASTTATVITDGGAARISFATAPDAVLVSTGSGAATLAMPGGPYALIADSGGGPQRVGIATDPAASRSINVRTDGGPLEIIPNATG